jgi:hypothetical protein
MPRVAPAGLDRKVQAARRTFLGHFPGGFTDERYLDWERDYKVTAHEAWRSDLHRDRMEELMDHGDHLAIAQEAVRIESRTNLLFSFEKMALRDAVRSPAGARIFVEGLHDFLYGPGRTGDRFERWVEAVSRLPRKQTRVLTWPVVTVFGMIAAPRVHVFVKPVVTQIAAALYGFDLPYEPRPSWPTYAGVLALVARIRRDLRDLGPRDMIDVQSFLWVLGSEEYD